ncbi:hypothetical protein HY772_03315 [Candidatus Woesearchaeota archaeon]|nr:hypothetical protein [Candidatus Woesearchaeota archaeon]
MKIEIDTKSDRKEELRHIAHMLLRICDEAPPSQIMNGSEQSFGQNFWGNPAEPVQPSQQSDSGFFTMFGDTAPVQSPQQPIQESGMSRASLQQGGDIFSLFKDGPPQQASTQPSPPPQDRLSRKRDFLAEGYLIPYD